MSDGEDKQILNVFPIKHAENSFDDYVFERPEINPRNIEDMDAFKNILVEKVVSDKICSLRAEFPFDQNKKEIVKDAIKQND